MTTDPQCECVLVFAPEEEANDLRNVLRRAGLIARVCSDLEDLIRQLASSAGAALVDEQVLTAATVQRLTEALTRSDVGPEFPLVLVCGPDVESFSELRWPDLIEALDNVTVLERPVRPVSVISALRAALRARRREIEIRGLLHEQKETVRARDEFLALFAHALRTPLGTIRNAKGILDRVGSQASLAVRERAVIERQADQLSRLIADVLELSRVATGEVVLRSQPADLREIARRALKSVEADVREAKHRLSFAPGSEPVMIEGDRQRLEQALTNLLDNAVRHTPAGGRINVSIANEAGEAVVRVSDSGDGIPADVLPHILSRSAELHHFRNRPAEGGMKIGLTLVRHLAELHGGSIAAASRGVGQGSEFTLRLPLQSAVLTPAPARATVAPTPPPRRLLLVEDNPDGRETMQLLLQLWGYQVEVAVDGLQGVQKGLMLRPELALIDIGLPGLDGYQVARELRAACGRSICLIAVTGYGGPQDRHRAREAGFDAHLVKPVDPDMLRELLIHPETVLRERAATT